MWTQPSTRVYSLAWFLRRVLQRSLLITGEQFRGMGTDAALPRVAGRYSINELAMGTPGFDPSGLPLRLFRLKNGSPEDQSNFRRVQELFTRAVLGEMPVSAANLPISSWSIWQSD